MAPPPCQKALAEDAEDWAARVLTWLSFLFQSQYKFVCEAILRVYEEGLVQMLDPS